MTDERFSVIPCAKFRTVLAMFAHFFELWAIGLTPVYSPAQDQELFYDELSYKIGRKSMLT